jgi:hypothetical protein
VDSSEIELGGLELGNDVNEEQHRLVDSSFGVGSYSVTSVTHHAMSRPQDDRNQEATVYLVSILYPRHSLKSHLLAGKP